MGLAVVAVNAEFSSSDKLKQVRPYRVCLSMRRREARIHHNISRILTFCTVLSLRAYVKASALPPLPLTSSGDSKASNKAMKKAKLYTPAATNALQLTSSSRSEVPVKRDVQQLKRVTIKAEDMNGALAIVSCVVVTLS